MLYEGWPNIKDGNVQIHPSQCTRTAKMGGKEPRNVVLMSQRALIGSLSTPPLYHTSKNNTIFGDYFGLTGKNIYDVILHCGK